MMMMMMMRCWLWRLLVMVEVMSVVVVVRAGLSEREILLELYESTGGSSWNNNNGWNVNSNDLCDWYGVICVGNEDLLDTMLSHDRRKLQQQEQQEQQEQQQRSLVAAKVIGLNLQNNHLNGRIPSSIWELPLLQELSVSSNAQLDVTFIGSDKNERLSVMKLHSTGLTSLNGISGFKNTLQSLHMSATRLETTTIPSEVFLLTSLVQLHMAECSIHGTIPDQISKLSHLEQLNLLGNSLSGTLPYSLSNLSQLKVLTMSDNQLTGTIPSSFLSTTTTLESLYLDNNAFQGPLPSFATLTQLQELYLNYNYLTGTIPSDFLSSVVTTHLVVNLDNNRLTGTVPSTLDNTLQSKSLKLSIADNLLTSIDVALCDNELWMDGLVGTINDDDGGGGGGCNAIACPVGTFAPLGRATNDNDCMDCPASLFVGQTYCLDSDDFEALEALYTATGGPQWTDQDNWLSSDNSKDVCDWYGITCWTTNDIKRGRVKHVSLPNNNLQGMIPQSIYAMEFMTDLNLSRNNVVLSFDSIGNAARLHKVNIAHTQTKLYNGIENATSIFRQLIADKTPIDGTLPTAILQIDSLETLSLSYAGLSGSIGTEIGQLTSLQYLYLFDNNLSGPLPSSALSQLTNMKVLALSKNKFTGVLPATAFAAMTNLQALSLQDQVTKGGGLSGQVLDFTENSQLQSLYLHRNKLEGSVPSELLRGADLDAAIQVDLSSNMLTGTVPGSLSRFTRLNLFCENNYITGIDQSLCALDGWMNGNVRDYGCDAILCPASTTSLAGRRMFDNDECRGCSLKNNEGTTDFLGQTVCGGGGEDDDDARDVVLSEEEILVLLYERTNGRNWHSRQNWNTDFDFCDWYGISCDEAKSVVSIVLGSNNLQGSIPTAIYQLPNLSRLSLFSNAIQLSFDGIDKARNLQSLILDNTGLTSLDGIGQARGLKELNVRFNKLQGTIPEEIQQCVHLEALEVSNNNLSGPLPSWIGKLPVLETLVASHNRLDGPLVDFSSNENLAFLDLSDNKLSGPVPSTFLENSNEDEKVFVDLSKNQLTGTVPSDLARLKRLSIHLMDNRIEGLDKDLCSANTWNDSDVQDYGCAGILCPAGTYSNVGRQSNDDTQCEPCNLAKYMGATKCTSGALRIWASVGAIGSLAVLSTVYLVL